MPVWADSLEIGALRDKQRLLIVPVPDDGLVLFRLLAGDTAAEVDFRERASWVDMERRETAAVCQNSVSTFLSADAAARRRTKGWPAFVAQLHLAPQPNTVVAYSPAYGGREHVDVWSIPAVLLATVARELKYDGPP